MKLLIMQFSRITLCYSRVKAKCKSVVTSKVIELRISQIIEIRDMQDGIERSTLGVNLDGHLVTLYVTRELYYL